MNRGGQGSDPLPEPGVTLRVEGKPVQFLVDTGAQHSVLLESAGPLSNKKIFSSRGNWEQTVFMDYWKNGGTWHGQGNPFVPRHPRVPLPLVRSGLALQSGGPDSLSPRCVHSRGVPLQVLTMKVEDQHQLYEVPKVTSVDMQDWMTRFLRAWAETAGMGTAE